MRPVCTHGLATLPPRFSVNADSTRLKGLYFPALLQVLILKGLAELEFSGFFESLVGQGASATDGDGAH
jgi:hypothetical protein